MGFHIIGNSRPLSTFMHGPATHSDVDGLCCSFLPVSSDTPLDCATVPINCMVRLISIFREILLDANKLFSCMVQTLLLLPLKIVTA